MADQTRDLSRSAGGSHGLHVAGNQLAEIGSEAVKFFPRLALAHLTLVLVASGACSLFAAFLAATLMRPDVEQLMALIGPSGPPLRPSLEAGMRGVVFSALAVSFPLAVGVAALAALVATQRVARDVVSLRDESHDLATGNSTRRLPARGQDELSDLARHFNRMADSLEQVEQSRAELITNVTHDLRTPLSALRGYAEALDDQVLVPDVAAAAILRETQALERLAGRFSRVSAAEAGTTTLHLTTFQARDVLWAAHTQFTAAASELGLRLMLDLPLGSPAVTGDEARTIQVMALLLDNALRHTPSGGQITLSAHRKGGVVIFGVRDTGSGIAEEHLGRVFERFYQVNPARTRGAGTGIGLTVARALVTQMGGILTVKSGPGGSTFTFTLLSAHPG